MEGSKCFENVVGGDEALHGQASLLSMLRVKQLDASMRGVILQAAHDAACFGTQCLPSILPNWVMPHWEIVLTFFLFLHM